MSLNANKILSALTIPFFYCIFFGTFLQYGTEISYLDLSRQAFYITQANYCACFLIVYAILIMKDQRPIARLIISSTAVNLLTALIYTVIHITFIGDWATLWRRVEFFSPFFLLFIIANFASHLAAELLTRSFASPVSTTPQSPPPDHLSSSMRYAYASLGKRTDELRRSATIAIFGIVAVLLASALLFIFAGQIATLGNLRVNAYEEARALQERQARRVDGSLSDLSSATRYLKDNIASSGSSSAIEKINAATDALKTNVDQINKIDEELRGMRDKLMQSQIDGKKNIDIEFMIFSSVTRFGVLGISAYLVYILVNLYRFNILQAAFYESIRDAILINGKIDPTDIGAIQALRSDIGFGSMHEKTLTSILSEIKNLLGNERKLAPKQTNLPTNQGDKS